MITELFLKGRLRHELSHDEEHAIEDAIHEVIEIDARDLLIERAEKVDRSYYLVDGFMLRYIDDKSGYRQIVAMQVPGDWVDLHSFSMKRLDHDVTALSACKLAVYKHDRLQKLVADYPHLARVMWYSTLLDAAMHREWIFRLGRLNAEGRIAHLVCELIERLRFVGRYDDPHFPVPLTQQDFGESCGLSTIHTNRTFRLLRERGLLERHDGSRDLKVLDEAGLRKLGEFNGDYLYGQGALYLSDPYDTPKD